MSHGRDSTASRLDSPRRILAAVGSRLAGRWEDPAAWRVLCEETAAVWRCSPDVRWGIVCPRGPLGGIGPEAGTGDLAAVWSVASGEVAWRAGTCDDAFWHRLGAARGVVVGGTGCPPTPVGDGPTVVGEATAGWLAVGAPPDGQPSLALLLGLDRPPPGPADEDALAADLRDVAQLLAPLVGQRRAMIDVAAEVAVVRAECETLSRLGELRAHLAAVTAHELKTPLTSITAYAEVLEQQAGDPGFAYGPEFLRVIRSEADRLLRLVDRLLDSSRRGRSHVLAEAHPVAVSVLVEDVLRAMAPQASARDLQLVGRVPDDLPAIAGDDDLIRQVLLNLIGNALKFTPAGGRVVVAVREDTSMVRLAVTDNGPGIPPHELRAIFQSFYRTRSARQVEGVGLGLSIVKEITSLHGGHLDVQSRLGRGTTFGVLLPKEQHHATTETALTRDGFDPARQQRVNELCLRLISELALARGVLIMLPDAEGERLLPAASLGLGADALTVRTRSGDAFHRAIAREAGLDRIPRDLASAADLRPGEVGAAMLATFRLREDGPRGLVLGTRRLGGGLFGEDDLVLLRVLADILGNVWSAVLSPDADRHVLDQVTEALAALAGLRRGGVPTADPLALRLLSRTGRRLGLSTYEIRLLQYAGALHDAGMVLLDTDVLHKPEHLDVDERDHVGDHPQRGLDVLGPLVGVPQLQAVIRHHHERVDGRGYPDGRRGDAIPIGARILAVVDAFFAMIRSRPWREGLPVAAAVHELQRNAGTQFDASVVAAFTGVLQETGFMADTTTPGPVGAPQGGHAR